MIHMFIWTDVVDVCCLAMFVARKGVVQIQTGLQTVLQEVSNTGNKVGV